jgi:chemotaxis protein CheD
VSRDGKLVIGISEFALTADPAETLVTYSLGSCIGVTLYDPVAGVGGLLHAMMPVSIIDPARAHKDPAMFADTGTALLLQGIFDLGAKRETLVAKLAGGAAPVDQVGRFRVGARNHMVVRRLLWKNDILIAAEDCGGTASRTVMLEMATGRTLIRSNGSWREL